MADDIVARLLSLVIFDEVCSDNSLGREAADEIERLRERRDDWRAAMTENHDLWNENERLRAALREIGEVYAGSEGIPQPITAAEGYLLQLLMEMVGIARVALEGEKTDG
jgi:regulator of replication initiation timing